MKKKNIISSILLSTLIIGFSVKAEEENIEQIFEENIPIKSVGSSSNTVLFLGASGAAALATGVGSTLFMKFKNDKERESMRGEFDEELDKERGDKEQNLARYRRVFREKEELKEASAGSVDREKALAENLKFVNQKLSDIEVRNKKTLEDFVRVEREKRELLVETQDLNERLEDQDASYHREMDEFIERLSVVAEEQMQFGAERDRFAGQLGKILPDAELKEAARVLKLELDQDSKEYIEAIAPLQIEIEKLDRQITLKEENSFSLQGYWLENAKEEGNKLIEQRDFIVEDLRAREQGYKEEIDIYRKHAVQKIIQEHSVPEFEKVFAEEIALAELKDFVEIAR